MLQALHLTAIIITLLAFADPARSDNAIESALRTAEGRVASQTGDSEKTASDSAANTRESEAAEKTNADEPDLEQAVYPGVKNLLIQRGGSGEPAIHLYYPSVGNETVDKALKEFAEGMANSYEEELKANYEDPEARPSSWDSWAESGFFTVSRPNPDIISVTFNIGYYTGGAHGQLLIAVKNYDLKTGKLLELDDLFARPQEAIAILSRVSESKLRESLGPDLEVDMLKSGTAPEAANFQNLSLQPNGLVVEFQPYQVGPWVIGLQHVDVSLEELANAGPSSAIWPAAAPK